MNNYILFVIISILVIGIIFILSKKTKYTETFTTPNFIQVFPTTGNAPLTVAFVPIYANEFSPFIIDFGDGDVRSRNTTDEFAHIYNKKGTYNGMIKFTLPNVEKNVRQSFTVICT